MGGFINLLCRFLGHKKGQTWEHHGETLCVNDVALFIKAVHHITGIAPFPMRPGLAE